MSNGERRGENDGRREGDTCVFHDERDAAVADVVDTVHNVLVPAASETKGKVTTMMWGLIAFACFFLAVNSIFGGFLYKQVELLQNVVKVVANDQEGHKEEAKKGFEYINQNRSDIRDNREDIASNRLLSEKTKDRAERNSRRLDALEKSRYSNIQP